MHILFEPVFINSLQSYWPISIYLHYLETWFSYHKCPAVQAHDFILLDLIPSPHPLVWATSERRVPTLVATNGSHWLN